MILEFDKTKRLLTPWGITTYGYKVNLQLEFDLPTCACFESINNITLNIYKKGEAETINEPLLTTSEFSISDQTTWFGSIIFLGTRLLEYVQSLADTTAILDGQFVFQVAGNKTVKSQVFYIKLYECPGPNPPGPVYPTIEETQDMIDVGIAKHDMDQDAHSELLSKYATIEYTDSLISTEIVNTIDLLTKETSDNHYVYDANLDTFTFDIRESGPIIQILDVDKDIDNITIKFINSIPGKEISLYINKNKILVVNYIDSSNTTINLVDNNIPSDCKLVLNFVPTDNDIKFKSGNIL